MVAAVTYDEASFWAGVSLGRALKGWSGSAPPGSGGKLSEIVVRSGTADFIEVPAEDFYGIGKVTVIGDAELVPGNIKFGVDILGVVGSYAPSPPKLMAGTGTATSNGTHTFYPSGGYAGLSRMSVTVDVPTEIKSQSKSVTPGYSSTTVTPDSGFNCLSSVHVAGDTDLIPGNIRAGATIFGVAGTYLKTEVVDAILQYKSVTPGRDAQNVSPDSGYNGLSQVHVSGDGNLISSNIREGVTIFGVSGSYSTDQKYQSKTVTPTKNGCVVTADSSYNALASVVVLGDSNLVPNKIADGVTIFGVRGTHVSPMTPLTIIPSVDEQYILPADGFYGFSSVTVMPMSTEGLEDNAIYKAGYNDGWKKGYDQAWNEVKDAIWKEAYEKGWAEGNQTGYIAGYADGYNAGKAEYGNA